MQNPETARRRVVACLDSAVEFLGAQRAALGEELRRHAPEPPRPLPPSSPLWGVLQNHPQKLTEITGLPLNFVTWLVGQVDEIAPSQRGRVPLLSLADGVVGVLITLNTTAGPHKIAVNFDLPPSAFSIAINHAVPLMQNVCHYSFICILFWIFDTCRQVLERRQAVLRAGRRPVLLEVPHEFEEQIAWIGAISDATPIPIHKPVGNFRDAKHFYSVHSGCYCMRIELVITASAPHQLLFWSTTVPGSTSDLTLHRTQIASCLTPYLAMTAAEDSDHGNDQNRHHWALLQDAGYIGHVGVPYPRLVLPKVCFSRRFVATSFYIQHTTQEAPQDSSQRRAVRWLKSVRINVERFIGRFKSQCPMFTLPFCLDRERLEMWTVTGLLLTNESIKMHALAEADREVYLRWLSTLRARAEAATHKRQQQQHRYYETTKQRRRMEEAAAAEPAADMAASEADSLLDDLETDALTVLTELH